MSMPTQYDPYCEFERALNVEMLQSQIFGAFFAAIEFRKTSVNLTNVEIAKRSGWSRSHVTKIMAHPQNWTIETIGKMATALDLEFKFFLVDRADRSRGFDANGLIFDIAKMPPGRKVLKRHNRIEQPDIQEQASRNFDFISNDQTAPIQDVQAQSVQNARQSVPVPTYFDIDEALKVGAGQ